MSVGSEPFDSSAQQPGDGPDLKPGDLLVDLVKIKDLKTMTEKERSDYLPAILSELNGMIDKNVFRLALEPLDQKQIPTRFVLKVKYNADGSYDKHKARLVVKGFLARLGVDYYATYAPTTMLATARLVMAAGVRNGVPVRHVDIAFLQAAVSRPIYISLPTGIGVNPNVIANFRRQHPHGNICFRLIRSLYGLSNAPMIFSQTLATFLKDLGMTRTRVDSTLFSHVDPETGKWTVVTAFVDDLLITGTDDAFEKVLRDALVKRFGAGLTWADNVSSFLGLNCKSNASNTHMTISAGFKVNQLFERLKFGADGKYAFRRCTAPYSEEFTKIKTSEGPYSGRQAIIKQEFASIVGVLTYLSICCRPDITTVLNKCAQGTSDPQRHHVLWLERLLAYIFYHPDQGLVYSQDASPVITDILRPLAQKYTEIRDAVPSTPYVCFSDANFADATDDKLRSTSGYCVYVHGCLIIWSSRRQSICAKSTLEAELQSASDECVWLFHVAQSVPFLFDFNSANPIKPVPLLIDNEPSLSTACHPKITAQTKHIALREFRIRDALGDDDEPPRIRCLWCPTKFNVADHFTKILGKNDFPRLAQFLVNTPPDEIRAAASMPGISDLPTKPSPDDQQAQFYLDAHGTRQPLDLAWCRSDDCDYEFYHETPA